jgi:hypothetical protein
VELYWQADLSSIRAVEIQARRLLIYRGSMTRYSSNSSDTLLPAERRLGPCRLFLAPSASLSETAGLANPGLTVPWQVADTTDSVRQGTTDPRHGNNPTCFD